MPERLRLDNIRPTPVKPTDIKPPSPSTETQLAPLRFAKAKQSPVPLNIKPQAAGSSSPREVGTPENENGWQWARKVKAKTDPLVFSPGRFVNCDAAIKVVTRYYFLSVIYFVASCRVTSRRERTFDRLRSLTCLLRCSRTSQAKPLVCKLLWLWVPTGHNKEFQIGSFAIAGVCCVCVCVCSSSVLVNSSAWYGCCNV